MTLCRVAAFVDGLRIIAAKEQDKKTEIGQISTEGIKALQDYTVGRSNQYAKRNFPNLSFPDETEREICAGTEMAIPAEFGRDESADLLGGTLDRNFSGRSHVGATIRPGVLLGVERKRSFGFAGLDLDSDSGQ